MTNLSTAEGPGWVYAAWLPAQPAPTQVRYAINASNARGYRVESFFFTVASPTSSRLTQEQQNAWILTVIASLSMASSVIAMLYWYVSRRLHREGK